MKKLFIFLIIFLLIFNFSGNTKTLPEHTEDNITEVYNFEDNFVFSTARRVTAGDRYISKDNNEYIVRAVEDNRAIAENIGEIDLINDEEVQAMPPLATERKTVGIYHAHNAESYVPEISANGEGDVHEVGETFKNALKENTIDTIHLENMHLPHDGGAYSRARRTAEEILEHNPDAKFDIHRDAIPDESEYIGEDGEVLVRLVVGRQNPNKEVNEEFARNLKSVSDNNNNRVRDIFFGQGEYNQSLHPRSLLLEVGTFENDKEEAKIATAHIAEDISQLLYGGVGDQPVDQSGLASRAWRTIAWILVIFVIGVLGYLYINERSGEGVMNRLREFFQKEIFDRSNNE